MQRRRPQRGPLRRGLQFQLRRPPWWLSRRKRALRETPEQHRVLRQTLLGQRQTLKHQTTILQTLGQVRQLQERLVR